MRIFLSVFPCGRRSFDADKLKNAVFKFTRRSVDAASVILTRDPLVIIETKGTVLTVHFRVLRCLGSGAAIMAGKTIFVQ